MDSYSYSLFIFEPNTFVFVFGFYFWTEYIRIRIRFIFPNRIVFALFVEYWKSIFISMQKRLIIQSISFFWKLLSIHLFILMKSLLMMMMMMILTFFNANISLGRKKSLSMFALSNVSSIFLPERMHSNTGYIFSVFICLLKWPVWEDA